MTDLRERVAREFADAEGLIRWQVLTPTERHYAAADRVLALLGGGEPGIEKDDEGRPYQCGAFVVGDPRWHCILASDHPSEHEWRLRTAPDKPATSLGGTPAPFALPVRVDDESDDIWYFTVRDAGGWVVLRVSEEADYVAAALNAYGATEGGER